MSYKKPQNIEYDMGGVGNKLDVRMQEIFELLNFMPKDVETVLDIGFGRGQIPYRMKNEGKKVTSIGLELESYGVDLAQIEKDGIKLIEANVENMPFDDNSFDCVIASHILEHVPNMGIALQEIRRVLKKNGYLVLLIPKYDDYICAGHINTGWNIGQLIYVLCLNQYNVRDGHFVEYGYSLCAMVQKSLDVLPSLRGDRGDIQILEEAGLLPFRIKEKNGDGFDSRQLVAVNWEHTEIIHDRMKKLTLSRKLKVALVLRDLLCKLLGKDRVKALGYLFIDGARDTIINPTEI